MQNLYEKMRAEEENNSRVVLYINNQKLKDAEALENHNVSYLLPF